MVATMAPFRAPVRQVMAAPQFAAARATLADLRGLSRQLLASPTVRAEPPVSSAPRTPPARRERVVDRPVRTVD